MLAHLLTRALPGGLARRTGPQGPPADRLSREASVWAIRLFLGREPRDEAEIALHRRHGSLDSLRTAFALTPEVRGFVQGLLPRQPYRAPLFLLEPPADPALDWRLAPPSLSDPVTQLCTGSQVEEPAYPEWCRALDLRPDPHRKVWEFAYIAAAMRKAGLLRPGLRALGFGVGQEPLPAFLAREGLSVLATDAPPEVVAGQGWDSTSQHASGLGSLARPNIIGFEQLRERVEFRHVDMNHIPADLHGFDLCWSACALEHLGSLEQGLRFIERSLDTLRPGGIAVHTTEFNLDSNDETLETPALSLFRRCDIEAFLSRMAAAGHRPWPLNLHPGAGELDSHIDLPPYALPHLKLLCSRVTTTSLGIVIEKG